MWPAAVQIVNYERMLMLESFFRYATISEMRMTRWQVSMGVQKHYGIVGRPEC